MNRRTQTAPRSLSGRGHRQPGHPDQPVRPHHDQGLEHEEAGVRFVADPSGTLGTGAMAEPSLVEAVRPLGQAPSDPRTGSGPRIASRSTAATRSETSVEELLGHAAAPLSATSARPNAARNGGPGGPASSGRSRGSAAVAEQLVIVDDDHPDLGVDGTRGPAGTAGFGRAWRLQAVPDINGPRVRLGLVWLVLVAVGLAFGPWTGALVLAPVAAVGAVQAAAALRKAGGRAHPLVAGGAAIGVVLAGMAPTSRAVGLMVLVAVVASLISGLHAGGFDLVGASSTVRAWLGVALAAVAPVVLARFEPALAVLALLLVCSYDAGDFLVGSAASTVIEGPLAGVVAVIAVGCGALALHPSSLSDYRLWPAVVLTALACPIGQVLGSATLPRADAFAPGLRRLDSLMLTGPLWLLLFD